MLAIEIDPDPGRNRSKSQLGWRGLTLMLIALSSTSKIKSRRTRSALGDGCSTDASIWRPTSAGASGLSSKDACMNDNGVMSEPRFLASPSRGNAK
jgi:hypothetical protein